MAAITICSDYAAATCALSAVAVAATSALSAAERSYPTSKVRGSGREFQAVTAQERPRRATQVQGQGRRPRGDTLQTRSGVVAGRSYPTPPGPRPEAVARRSYPRPEARGSGQEDQPHIQGAVTARAQEGLEKLSHVEGQEGRR